LGSFLRPFSHPVVELFWWPKIDPQGGLLNGLKKWLILGVEKEPKNALKIGFKME